MAKHRRYGYHYLRGVIAGLLDREGSVTGHGGRTVPEEVSRLLHTRYGVTQKPSSLSGVLRKMHEEGLILRQMTARGGRIAQIDLTDRGRKLVGHEGPGIVRPVSVAPVKSATRPAADEIAGLLLEAVVAAITRSRELEGLLVAREREIEELRAQLVHVETRENGVVPAPVADAVAEFIDSLTTEHH